MSFLLCVELVAVVALQYGLSLLGVVLFLVFPAVFLGCSGSGGGGGRQSAHSLVTRPCHGCECCFFGTGVSPSSLL